MGVGERCRELCSTASIRQVDKALCDACETHEVRYLEAEHQEHKTHSGARLRAAQHPSVCCVKDEQVTEEADVLMRK